MVVKNSVDNTAYTQLINKKVKIDLIDHSFVVGILKNVSQEEHVFQVIDDKFGLIIIQFDKVLTVREWVD